MNKRRRKKEFKKALLRPNELNEEMIIQDFSDWFGPRKMKGFLKDIYNNGPLMGVVIFDDPLPENTEKANNE